MDRTLARRLGALGIGAGRRLFGGQAHAAAGGVGGIEEAGRLGQEGDVAQAADRLACIEGASGKAGADGDPFTGPGPHVVPDGAAAGETGPDGLDALPGWLRRAVLSWGVRRSPASWVGGVLGGVAERYRIDPLLARGVFVAVCMISAGLGLLLSLIHI